MCLTMNISWILLRNMWTKTIKLSMRNFDLIIPLCSRKYFSSISKTFKISIMKVAKPLLVKTFVGINWKESSLWPFYGTKIKHFTFFVFNYNSVKYYRISIINDSILANWTYLVVVLTWTFKKYFKLSNTTSSIL